MKDIQLVDVKSLEIVWELLYGGLEFEDGEEVEIAYNRYTSAKHVKTLADFIETAKQLSGNSDVTISPCTKKIPKEKKDKRTGKDEAYRQKCIILDIDNPNNHSFFNEEDAKKLADKVLNQLPEGIRETVVLIGYTGGGIQIYLSFEPLIGLDNIKRAHELLKEILKPISLIDSTSSFTPGHLQRLLGTLNLKHGVLAKELDTALKDKKSLTLEFLTELKREIDETIPKTLDEAIKLIKKRVRVKDLGLLDLKEMNGYWMALCPFHNETTPSFSIKPFADGDKCKDFHDGKTYDVIDIYQQLTGRTFNETIEDLAKIGGIDLLKVKEQAKVWGKVEKNRAVEKLENGFDPEAYVDELPIEKIEKFVEDGIFTLEITGKHIEGFTYSFKATIGTLAKWERFKHLFLEYAGVNIPEIPKKGREEGLMQVIEILRERAEKSKNFLRNMDEEILEAILEELAREDFGTFKEFFETPELKQGFKDDDNNYYTTLPILKRIAKRIGFNITQNKLKDIILKAGGEYIRYYEEEKRKWVYRLPNSFKPIEKIEEPEVW